MIVNDLTRQFAHRLIEALIKAGYSSNRSISGVDINQLSNITGYSSQICRKYLKGEAIPEPSKLVELANNLQVSPGWLLFGDANDKHPEMSDKLTIRKNLIHYIFIQAKSLYNSSDSAEAVGSFLVELVEDVSQINASEEQSKRIIDLALMSALHFQQEQVSHTS